MVWGDFGSKAVTHIINIILVYRYGFVVSLSFSVSVSVSVSIFFFFNNLLTGRVPKQVSDA